MKKIVEKIVNLELVGLDGNAFYLMEAFSKQAKREGWTNEEIKLVLNEARSSDYDHLVATLSNHCEVTDTDDECQHRY